MLSFFYNIIYIFIYFVDWKYSLNLTEKWQQNLTLNYEKFFFW